MNKELVQLITLCRDLDRSSDSNTGTDELVYVGRDDFEALRNKVAALKDTPAYRRAIGEHLHGVRK